MNIFNFYLGVLFVCLFSGIICYPFATKEIRVVLLLILITTIVELIGGVFFKYSKINGIIYKAFMPIEYLILSFYFYLIFNTELRKKIVLIFVFIVLGVELYGIIAGLTMFRVIMIAYFCSAVLSLIYLKQLLNFELNVFRNPNFWIVTGILFFNAGFFFLSGVINFIVTKNVQLATKLFSINHILNIIYYSLISYGFICQRRLAKS